MKTFYFLKNQDWLKFLKPAERAEIDAAEQAFRESEDGHVCQHLEVDPKAATQVHQAAPWWAPHDSPECNVFTRPRADCDCSADTTW